MSEFTLTPPEFSKIQKIISLAKSIEAAIDLGFERLIRVSFSFALIVFYLILCALYGREKQCG